MIKQAFTSFLGGLGLSWLSLLESEETQANVEREGFPFSFINDHQSDIASGKDFVANQLDVGSALANIVFWAIVAYLLFKMLSWIFDKFSKAVFIVAIIAVAATYLGAIQLT